MQKNNIEKRINKLLKKEWWHPTLKDAKYVKSLRKSYPETCDGLSDEAVIEEFANIWEEKYSTTWDGQKDAYEQYEPLADAFLEALKIIKELKFRIDSLEK